MPRTLLVIDIQNDYFPGGVLPLWQAEETEARLLTAIANARQSGDQVILIRHLSTAETGLFAADSPGSAIRPAILAAAGDAPVILKHFADSFQNTDLSDYLKAGEELLVCGMMTQNCVVFTALSRSADPYQVKILKDLCTAPSEIVHRIALNALGSKCVCVDAADLWAA